MVEMKIISLLKPKTLTNGFNGDILLMINKYTNLRKR